ncbi:multiple sugar transport system substrate-binding protein [Paenibacillus sophorae]|uniref:Extracellular solute-binding protein n=1 Tax=Paenibacillus sophorae TaxID=1333845 RepID=A0A1H8SCX4_9BACL|nr:extracellular solute-binding protein [Paenibacillus sophorae]QWU16771.1 extracellular solute-binding protein [Paenibacillus sophorae]SEO76425.1 multiple sugar transport system substrate-binding protein [Paenibacillus sophorae]
MATRWISFILILLLTAGCGGTSMISNPESVQTLQGNDKTVLIFWHTYNDRETRILMQELIPAFERDHPDIRIKCINLANNNELKYSLIARASSGRGPDVVRMDIAWVPEFSHKGLLEPLNGFPGFNDLRDAFHQKAMSAGYYNDQYYSIPLNLYTKLTIFNRELLARSGYSEPPHTMDEILELARKQHFVIGLAGLGPWDTLPYLYSLGGLFMDRDFTRASGYLNSDRTVRAVEKLADLYKDKLIHLSALTQDRDNWAGVRNGSMLLTDEAPWFFSLLKESDKRQALKQTLSVPFPKRNGTSSIIGGENLVIMKGSRHPVEAWVFMKWMTGLEGQLIMAKAGLIPTNKEAVKALNVSSHSYLYPYVEEVDDSFLRPPVKNWSKIDEMYTVYMNQIFLGHLSAREGLDRAAEEIDKLLKD